MSCGAPTSGSSLAGVDLASQTIIEGVVARDGAPVAGAYVRLLDRSGEFTAEVPTGDEGSFRFFAAPGPWTVRTLAPKADPTDVSVTATRGEPTELQIAI